MIRKNKKKLKALRSKKGFTLIEALILLTIFLILISTFYRIFNSGTQLLLEAKKKIIATGIANSKLEEVRAMNYDDIGTTDGSPNGIINPNENVTSGNYEFQISYDIRYVDDPIDKLGEDDSAQNDYKNVIITTKWGEKNNQQVKLSSLFSPYGKEVGVDGGTLSVNVIDIDGNPVSDASVSVVNTELGYSQITETNDSGNVSLIGLNPSEQSYVIEVSKSGYENTETLPPYPINPYYPTDVHASVFDNDITTSVIVCSDLADIQVKFIKLPTGNVSDVNFDLMGGRVLGTNTDGTLVYNFDQSLESDGAGVLNIKDLSPGYYTIMVNEPGYTFWKTDAGEGNEADEIIVNQGDLTQVKEIKLLDNSLGSYFINVADLDTGNVIEGAEIQVVNSNLGYDETDLTDEYGYAFFPVEGSSFGELTNGETYDVFISADGYSNKNISITINDLTTDLIELSPL